MVIDNVFSVIMMKTLMTPMRLMSLSLKWLAGRFSNLAKIFNDFWEIAGLHPSPVGCVVSSVRLGPIVKIISGKIILDGKMKLEVRNGDYLPFYLQFG